MRPLNNFHSSFLVGSRALLSSFFPLALMGARFSLVFEVGLQGGRWGSRLQPSPLAAAALCLLSHAGWLSVDRPLAPQAFGMWPLPLKPASCKQPSCRGQKPATSCPRAGLGDPGGTWRSAPCPRGGGRGDRWAAASSQQGSDLLGPSAVPQRGSARAHPAQGFHRSGDAGQPLRSGGWAGGRRRGSAEPSTDQSSCNNQRLSIFSHFSQENRTESPEGKVSISQL